MQHLSLSSLSTKAFFQPKQQIDPFKVLSHQIYRQFHFFVSISHSICCHLHCEYWLQKDKVGGWNVRAMWGSSYLKCIFNFSTIELNYGMLCVHLFVFNLHLYLITLNAFSKVNSTCSACTSTSTSTSCSHTIYSFDYPLL